MNIYDLGDDVVLELPLTVDGVATDPTALTLTITPPSGAAVLKHWPSPLEITKVGVGSFRYDYLPTVAGLYAYEWAGTGAATAAERGYFEVRPAYAVNSPVRFCSVSDLIDALGRPVTRDASALRAIERASAMIQSYTYQTIAYVANDVVTLNPVGQTSILLPEVPVVAVSSVVEAGVALVLTDDYTWDADGILRRRWPQQSSRVWPNRGVREFPNEPASLVVTYSHGYQVIPSDIREVCLSMAIRSYQSTERAAAQFPGVLSETLPDHSVNWMPESRRGDAALGWSAAPFLLPSEEEILSSYRMRP